MAISPREGYWAVESDTDTASDTDLIFLESELDSSVTDDSEAEDLRQGIAFHAAQGWARSRWQHWSNKLVNREFQYPLK